MRSGRTISALRTASLSATAATELLLAALSGERAIAFVEADRSADLVEGVIGPADCALAVLTSGSTGSPKVVGLSGPALVASATAGLVRLGAARHATWSLLLPLHHIAGIQVLLRAVINEGAVVTVDEHADFTSIVPTQLQRAVRGDDRMLEHLRSATAVLVGGAALAPSLRAEAQAAGIRVVSTYGMTETGGGCIYDGTPLDGVDVRIDGDGRVAISGPMLALGYLNDPIAHAAAFSGDWFHTSDLGSITNGHVEISGRADAVINSGGEKISLTAVEEVVRHHPLVIDAIASGAPDATWGERLVVGILASGPVSLSDLREHVSQHLPRAHAPRALVLLRAIPTTGLGKPDRAALLTHPIDEEI